MTKNDLCTRQADCSLCHNVSDGKLTLQQYPKGWHFSAEKCTQNCMIFVLEGELLINSNEYPGTTLQHKQCVLQAVGSKVELLALTDVEYISYWFTDLPLICEDRYKEIVEKAEAPLTYTPLKANDKLEHFLVDLTSYLKESPTACGRFIDIKCQELMYILTFYYPMRQASTFFYPISTYTESFQYFIMQNYDKVKNVEEFAHLGGYSITTFRRMFKNVYKMPVYEWILAKKRQGILNDLQYTKQRISVICARYGFDSLSHFAHFCKDSFGDTPRALRKRAANGERIVYIKTKADNAVDSDSDE